MLTITSRYPYSLFIPKKPLLNRRGLNYIYLSLNNEAHFKTESGGRSYEKKVYNEHDKLLEGPQGLTYSLKIAKYAVTCKICFIY